MKNMLFYPNIIRTNLNNYIPKNATLFWDTESCFIDENVNIPMFIEDNKPNPEFNFEVHVYAWAIANDFNDNVIYGQNLDQFLDFIYQLTLSQQTPGKLYTEKTIPAAVPEIKIWCHNLQWDLEFLKYTLEKQLYTCENSRVSKINQKIPGYINRGHYNIIENTNIVYGCSLTHKKAIKIQYKDSSNNIKNKLQPIHITFHDSLKVTNTSLSNIATDLLTLPQDRLKIEGYDYDKHRPLSYLIDEEEQEYLYNDVFILKEWYNQYYKKLNTERVTASSIAFERICKLTFGDSFTYTKDFTKYFPEVTNYTAKRLIDNGYKGGLTQVNRRYVNEIIKFKNKKVSIDINSSYPSVLVNKPLPLHSPIASYDFERNATVAGDPNKYLKEIYKHQEEGKLVLLEIAFDGFKNKDHNNQLGEIQIGAVNRKEFAKYFPNVNSGQEYIHTNITKDGLIGGNCKHDIYRYVKTYWHFELDSLLNNMEFLIGEQEYCPDREFYYFPAKPKLKKGFKILGAAVFESYVGFFADGILDGVEKKKEGKKTGNKILEQSNKTYINSFYGKLAANPHRKERYSFYNEEKQLMDYKSTNVEYEDNKKYYKAMASCVTAWGRCNLRDTLYKVCSLNPVTNEIDGKFHNNVMYMDTDSLYTTLTGEQIEKLLGDSIDHMELGKWDIETEYTKFKAIGSKKYIYHGAKYKSNKQHELKCKCAGLPQEARIQQTFDSFYLGAEIQGKKVKKKVKGGYALVPSKYKICDNIL